MALFSCWVLRLTLLSDKHVRVDVFYRNLVHASKLGEYAWAHVIHDTYLHLDHLWLLGLCRGKLVDHGVFTRTRRYPSSLPLKL